MPDYSKYRWSVGGVTVKHGGRIAGAFLDTSLLDAMTREMTAKLGEIVMDIGGETALEASANAPFDTGDLARSYIEQSQMTGNAQYTIQDGVPYGIFQELGTSRTPAQPHVIPAFMKVPDMIRKALKELFK